MSIYLPLCSCVLFLGLCNRIISVCLTVVCWQLAEQQNVFRTSHAHLGAVLALLSPSEPVCLVILSYNIRNHCYHSKILKAMTHIVFYAVSMEWLNSRHSCASGISKQHSILNVDGCHSSRLQHPQKLRRQVVHLFKEPLCILIVSKVVIICAVLVVIAKWY